MSFHHPYHFVPVRKQSGNRLSKADFLGEGAKAVTHDRYLADRKSGRVLCRLTTVDPLVMGRETDPKPSAHAPGVVLPFELDGRAAIPASSLRGLISSLAEAASNSALRALEDQKTYSYRNMMGKGLSAVGLYIHKPGRGHVLCPLCLPTLVEQGGFVRMGKAAALKLFPEPVLKGYIGNFNSIRRDSFSEFRTYRHDTKDNDVWYIRARPRSWTFEGDSAKLAIDEDCHVRKGRANLLLSQVVDDPGPVRENEVPAGREDEYLRGIVRTLGAWLPDRKGAIPKTKKHELFLPLPSKPPAVLIPASVVARFHDMCAERATQHKKPGDPLLPFAPFGTDRSTADPKAGTFELKTGDLVYFGFDEMTGDITEISLSSIWRGRVEKQDRSAAGAFDFFRAVDPELLPFDEHRTHISIAEGMFGFVGGAMRSEPSQPSTASVETLALASRVRLSHGRLERVGNGLPLDQAYLPPVPLKILDSPKPPSPAFYFRSVRGDAFVAKSKLQPGPHIPHGRKFYLHRHPSQPEPWRTVNPRDQTTQKVTATPIQPGAEFWFHVDFDNLNDTELSLLLYSLRPNAEFRHKLGMGKPIGLGGVEITPVALLEVGRVARYTLQGFRQPRYSNVRGTPAGLPDSYSVEATALQGAPPLDLTLSQQAARRLYPDLAAAIELLGNPSAVRYPVQTPVVQVRGKQGTEDPEDESFRWFVANEQNGVAEQKDRDAGRTPQVRAQFLRPLAPSDMVLPHLTPIVVEPKER